MSTVIPAYYFPLPFILARMQWYPTVARQKGLWANAPAGDVPNSPIPHTPSPSLVFVHLLIYLPVLWSVIVRSYRPLLHRESARSYRPTVPSFPSSLGPTQRYRTVVWQQGLWANAPAQDVPNFPIPHPPFPFFLFPSLTHLSSPLVDFPSYGHTGPRSPPLLSHTSCFLPMLFAFAALLSLALRYRTPSRRAYAAAAHCCSHCLTCAFASAWLCLALAIFGAD